MTYPTSAAGRLMEYVGLPAPAYVNHADAVPAFVVACAWEANQLVEAWLGGQTGLAPEDFPGYWGNALARAELEVGAELYHRKNTKNAVAQFASPDGSPVRIARDPMVAAYSILRQLVGGGFA